MVWIERDTQGLVMVLSDFQLSCANVKLFIYLNFNLQNKIGDMLDIVLIWASVKTVHRSQPDKHDKR